MRIKSFVFNWNDNHENARNLQQQFDKVSDCTVISSTEMGFPDDNWVEIGWEKYFVGQWNKALELYDPKEYDVLLHAQADAHTDQVEEIVAAALKAFETTEWGIYAPNVDWSSWGEKHIIDRDYAGLENVHRMGGSDVTFWMVHTDILLRIPRKFNEEKNTYGHGIDILYYNICNRVLKRPILRDYNFTVDHEKATSYPGHIAMQQGLDNKEVYETYLSDCIKWLL
jgi:hypothetical protein